MERIGHKIAGLVSSVVLAGAVFFGSFGFNDGAAVCLSVHTVYAQGNMDEEDTVVILSDEAGGVDEVHIEGGSDFISSEEGEEKEADIASSSDAKDKGVKDKTAEFTARIKKNWDRVIDKMPSLFFTYWQHQSIITAKKAHGTKGFTRETTESELKDIDELELDRGVRYVSLGGIVYRGDGDWTIWINGERVTPDALPPEALDLRVYKDYIEVKWLDEYTNSVFPLRLRAHQRFNLDQRIFLPG